MSSRQPKVNPWLALLVLCLGNFVILLDTTIVNTATPSIINSLHATVAEILWVFSAYLMVFASLLIPGGRLGDVIGPRTAFVAGLGIFTVSSLLCGLSRNPAELIGARAVQGIGAALLIPQALVLITAMFPPKQRGAAMGIFVSLASVATIAGPTFGGLLVTDLGWTWVFFLNVPVGVVGVVLGLRLIPDIRPGRAHRFDVVGVLTGTAGMGAIGFGLIDGSRYGWGTIAGPVSIASVMGLGVVLMVVFMLWERHYPEPLLPAALFRNRNYSIAVSVNAIIAFALFGFLLSYVLLSQDVLQMTALRSGLTILPLAVTMSLFAPVGARLSDRIGARYVLTGGLVIAIAGLIGLLLVESATSTSTSFIAVLAVTGAGVGMAFPPSLTEAMHAAPPQLLAAASGGVNTARQMGGALGAAVTGLILQERLASKMTTLATAQAWQIQPHLRTAFINAFAQATKQGVEMQNVEQSGFNVAGSSNAYLQNHIVPIAQSIFYKAFTTDAMRTALSVAIGVLLVGAVSGWFLQRRAVEVIHVPAASDTTEKAEPVH